MIYRKQILSKAVYFKNTRPINLSHWFSTIQIHDNTPNTKLIPFPVILEKKTRSFTKFILHFRPCILGFVIESYYQESEEQMTSKARFRVYKQYTQVSRHSSFLDMGFKTHKMCSWQKGILTLNNGYKWIKCHEPHCYLSL